jgi:hypothetical protein
LNVWNWAKRWNPWNDLPAYTNTHHDHEHVLSSFIPYPLSFL